MKHKYINKIFESNNCGSFKVIKADTKTNYYIIEFLETKTILSVKSSHIIDGSIKDRYCKNIYGVACIGNTSALTKGKPKKLYQIWISMIKRCYFEKQINYNSYGGRGVYVCDRWLCFENFETDSVLIEGYDEERINKGLLHFDKDISNKHRNLYSSEYCLFVESEVNIAERNSRVSSKKIKCINTGEIFDSLTKASEWCNLKWISSISRSANSSGVRYGGKHPVTNERLYWEWN